MTKISCPHCGAYVDSSRTVCPNCRAVMQKKSSMIPYIIVAGLFAVVILVVAVLLLMPVVSSGGIPGPQVTVPPTPQAAEPATPACTIAISGRKNPPDKILLQVMTTTCFAGDITDLRVTINGEEKGSLSASPGSSATFTRISGSNNVVVTAAYASGAENVVYMNAAL